MAKSSQEIVDRAMQLATNTADDASRSVSVDAEATALLAVPHALRYVVRNIINSGQGVEDLMMEHGIILTRNEGTLPAAVLRQYLDRSSIPDVPFASYISYPDYQRYRFDNQLCYFTVRGSRFFYSCSGFVAGGVWTFNSNPVEGETIVVNGVTYTFRLDGAVVSDAGNSASDGLYTQRTFTGTFYKYVLNGHADNYGSFFETEVYSPTITQWDLNDAVEGLVYSALFATSSAAKPWEVGVFDATSGYEPAPTITRRVLSSTEVLIGSTLAETIANFVAKLEASTDDDIEVASYAVADTPTVTGTYNTSGATGNDFTMEDSSAGSITVSGPTFTGGTDFVLQAPGIPQLPSDPDEATDLSGRVEDDVIVTVAAVIKGEISLKSLIDVVIS